MNTLSPDLLYHFAITYLHYEDIVALDRTCKTIHRKLCYSPTHNIWKDLYIRDFTQYPVPNVDFRHDYIYNSRYYRLLMFRSDKLVFASKHGFEVLTQKIIDYHKPERNVLNNALNHAAEYGHLQIVKIMLSTGADIDTWSGYPLRWAIRGNHLDVAVYLIQMGASLDYGVNPYMERVEETEVYRQRLETAVTLSRR